MSKKRRNEPKEISEGSFHYSFRYSLILVIIGMLPIVYFYGPIVFEVYGLFPQKQISEKRLPNKKKDVSGFPFVTATNGYWKSDSKSIILFKTPTINHYNQKKVKLDKESVIGIDDTSKGG